MFLIRHFSFRARDSFTRARVFAVSIYRYIWLFCFGLFKKVLSGPFGRFGGVRTVGLLVTTVRTDTKGVCSGGRRGLVYHPIFCTLCGKSLANCECQLELPGCESC